MNKDLIINELQVNVAAFVINESKDTFKSEEPLRKILKQTPIAIKQQATSLGFLHKLKGNKTKNIGLLGHLFSIRFAT